VFLSDDKVDDESLGDEEENHVQDQQPILYKLSPENTPSLTET